MANSNGRELKAENYQVAAASPFFDKFVDDFLEQLCIDIIFAEDEKKIQHFQLEEKVKKYKGMVFMLLIFARNSNLQEKYSQVTAKIEKPLENRTQKPRFKRLKYLWQSR